jgi:hypothetical protein
VTSARIKAAEAMLSGGMANWLNSRRGIRAAGVVALALGVALLAAAASQAAKGRVLGAAKPTPASCPQNCLVEARVTGFQTAIGKHKKPFTAPRHGRIVAWSIKLGEPAGADIRYFNRTFGASKARLSILKPVRTKQGKRKYRLLRQSPVVRLRPFFGEITTFGLARQLPVRKGNIVALTISTWAPAFGFGQSQKFRWRASRAPAEGRPCQTRSGSNVDAGAAQDRKGTERPYRCLYRGSRLLYSARFIAAKGG